METNRNALSHIFSSLVLFILLQKVHAIDFWLIRHWNIMALGGKCHLLWHTLTQGACFEIHLDWHLYNSVQTTRYWTSFMAPAAIGGRFGIYRIFIAPYLKPYLNLRKVTLSAPKIAPFILLRGHVLTYYSRFCNIDDHKRPCGLGWFWETPFWTIVGHWIGPCGKLCFTFWHIFQWYPRCVCM